MSIAENEEKKQEDGQIKIVYFEENSILYRAKQTFRYMGTF